MTDPTLRKQQIAEAVHRMAALGLSNLAADDLRRDVLWVSTPVQLFDIMAGAAAPLSVRDAGIVEAARTWLYGVDVDALPYHAIVASGEMSDGSVQSFCQLLFVGSDHLEWAYERPLRQKADGPGSVFHIYCAVYNATHPDNSELGLISVLSLAGGLVRLK